MATKLPAFTYTGQYRTEMVGGLWYIYFLTSGVLRFSYTKSALEIFLVGGGGASGYHVGGGGGGGYTATHRGVVAAGNADIVVTIGAGGVGDANGRGNPGGASSFGAYSVAGGQGGMSAYFNGDRRADGGNGGSGGGGSGAEWHAGAGGADGGNGGSGGYGNGGAGQGRTTRAFEDPNGALYAGGGGGGSWKDGAGAGGAGGGASGNIDGIGFSAAANTGGGGGGGRSWAGGGNGGSGIVIIRSAEDDNIPVVFNGQQLQKIVFNGVAVTGLIYNGTRVFIQNMRRRMRTWFTSTKKESRSTALT